ncbi:HAMP domain-containing protein [Bacillus lacus]|uniref:histidine kinase n=1 Tax=Metabacillus lacus TaxID=1983721 RepID=A0A7X2IYN2_9BACI|nr:HAMP domain-containing sensor histidine kinase [Metabacillus lacus]MRX72059.1 HAMP domain-containing protein [Metabacillus lacus]
MKNKSLALQIWAVISGILLMISILLLVLFPSTLRSFFTESLYNSIENEQAVLTSGTLEDNPYAERIKPQLYDKAVQHIILPEDPSLSFYTRLLPPAFLRETQLLAISQESLNSRYSEKLEGETLYFIIKKISVNGEPSFLLSYAWDSYRNDLVFTLFKQLLIVMAIVFLLSWIPSLWLAKYLSRPLVALETHVNRISQQDWHEPVSLDRSDEIGKLAASIEDMRRKLVKKDESQRALLQNISHDLKTPVMVIRGYASSVSDGIFPKGDLESTMNVIEMESERLEKKIRNLLYLTKLDYLAEKPVADSKIDLAKTVYEVTDKVRWLRPELEWNTSIEPAVVYGDEELWTKLLENMLENQIRYAQQEVTISLASGEKNILSIENDGPPIHEELIPQLFEPFRKGSDGEFGIGLSIVKRIADIYGADITVSNLPHGVMFQFSIPLVKEHK